jgi:predicted nucleotidyltransferase
MVLHGVDIPEQRINELCRKHGVSRLALFGSILRPDFGPASDVDFLVEFPPGAKYSHFQLGELWMDLRDLVGREVDLKTPFELSRLFRDQVLEQSRTLYAA